MNSNNSALQQINEPSVTGRLHQIIESLGLAEMRAATLRDHLFGEAEQGKSIPPRSTVSGMVEDIATRLACLCGELATINTRMGCQPEPLVGRPHHDPEPFISQEISSRR